MTFAEELRAMNACEEAVAWVGDKTRSPLAARLRLEGLL